MMVKHINEYQCERCGQSSTSWRYAVACERKGKCTSATNFVTWDVKSDFNGDMPTRGRKPTGKVMKALIELHGKLEDTRVIDENVIYRIALPEGIDGRFEKRTGYHLTVPTKDF
jgi:hypothetical protein